MGAMDNYSWLNEEVTFERDNLTVYDASLTAQWVALDGSIGGYDVVLKLILFVHLSAQVSFFGRVKPHAASATKMDWSCL